MKNKSKITRREYCWSDEDGNVSFFSTFGSGAKALTAIQSLENCTRCVDSKDCLNCEDCLNGVGLMNCVWFSLPLNNLNK